ncbi:MAG: hypothetical protein KDD58_14935 [Bdellovibrionales bacterium]|nr:hypothetical protein [Bdellovibrionales bacterium]
MNTYLIIIILALNFTYSINSLACGGEMNDTLSANKMLAINFKDSDKNNKYAMDDDGLLVLTIIAAYCSDKIPFFKPKLEKSKKDCINKAQEKIDYFDRIDLNYYSDELKSKEKVNKVIKSKCSVDLIQQWEMAKKKNDNSPLDCRNEVKGLASRAAAQYEKYFEDLFNSEDWENLDGSQKMQILSEYSNGKLHVNQFVSELNDGKITNKTFREWELKYKNDIISKKFYPILNHPSDIASDEDYKPLKEVLGNIGVYYFGFKPRCAPALPIGIIGKIKKSDWDWNVKKSRSKDRSEKVN